MNGAALAIETPAPELSRVPPPDAAHDPIVMRSLKGVYRPVLGLALRRPRAVLVASLVGVLVAVGGLASFGRSFLPAFNEGAFTLAAATAPGTPLSDSDAMVRRLEERPGGSSAARKTI